MKDEKKIQKEDLKDVEGGVAAYFNSVNDAKDAVSAKSDEKNAYVVIT